MKFTKMCCGECIIKYTIIIGNIIFSLAGLGILGLGIAAHIQLKEITDLIPINLNVISIGIMVLGSVVFLVAFLACCGAILKSMWMLITYSIFMLILAGIKIYVTVVTFRFLDGAQNTVSGWLNDAFDNQYLRPAFLVMETFFQCCGTTGAESYGNDTIPASCCPNPINDQCLIDDSFNGCTDIVANWFESFGGIIGGIMIGVIIIELVCMIFGFHVCNTIRRDRSKSRTY